MGKRSRRWQNGLGPLLVAGLLVIGVLLQCGTSGTPGVGVASPDYEVRRVEDHDMAWATLATENDFVQLDNNWDALIENGQVTTDSNGEAELCHSHDMTTSSTGTPPGSYCLENECHIHVFEAGSFGYYSCSKEEIGGIACSVGAATASNCEITIQTLSADATGLGTWFSVIYLWEPQVTLIIAGEGQVTVTPVKELSFAGQLPPPGGLDPIGWSRQWRELQILTRTLGTPVTVKVDPGAARKRFLYTAPVAQLEKLRQEHPGLPTAGDWLPLDDLTVLRQELAPLDRFLEPWLDEVWQQAAKDIVPLPPLQPIPWQQEGLYLIGAGKWWDDSRFEEAVLLAIDWREVEKTFPGLPIIVERMALNGEETRLRNDARAIGYDRERARGLLAEAGLAGSKVVLAVLPEPRLQELSKYVAEYLGAAGLRVAVVDVPAGGELRALRGWLDEGLTVLWFSQR